MPEFSVKFDTEELTGLVSEYVAKGGQLSRITPTIGQILVEAIDYQFDTEGEGSWAASARAVLQGGKTLQDTGILAGSIERDFGSDWGSAGTDVPYGAFHLPPEKSGHPTTTGVMPVRDFLDINEDEVVEEISALFTEFATDV